MAMMKNAFLDVMGQSIDDEGLDTIEPSAQAVAAVREFCPNARVIEAGHARRLSDLELRRFAVGLDRFEESATA